MDLPRLGILTFFFDFAFAMSFLAAFSSAWSISIGNAPEATRAGMCSFFFRKRDRKSAALFFAFRPTDSSDSDRSGRLSVSRLLESSRAQALFMFTTCCISSPAWWCALRPLVVELSFNDLVERSDTSSSDVGSSHACEISPRKAVTEPPDGRDSNSAPSHSSTHDSAERLITSGLYMLFTASEPIPRSSRRTSTKRYGSDAAAYRKALSWRKAALSTSNGVMRPRRIASRRWR